MLPASRSPLLNGAAWDEGGRLFAGAPKLLAYGALPDNENHLFRDVEVDGEKNREVLLRSKFGGRVNRAFDVREAFTTVRPHEAAGETEWMFSGENLIGLMREAFTVPNAMQYGEPEVPPWIGAMSSLDGPRAVNMLKAWVKTHKTT